MRLVVFAPGGNESAHLRAVLEERGHALITPEESLRTSVRDIDAILAPADELPDQPGPRGPTWVALVQADQLEDLLRAQQCGVHLSVIVGSDPELTRSQVERMERDLALGVEVRSLRKTQEALERTEGDYRGLFEAAHDAILIFRPTDEIILDANERASEVYRIPRTDLIGSSLLELTIEPERGREHVQVTLERGKYHSFRTRQRRGDGTIMMLDINAARVDYAGAPAIVSINRDVSEVHNTRDQLRRQDEELRSMQRHEAIGRLAAGVAHDFNNLLSVIAVCAQAIQMAAPEHDEAIHPAIEDIEAATQDGAKMVRQLIELSRQQKTPSRVAKPNELIVSLGPLLNRLVGKHCALALELDDRAPHVVGESAQLERVLVNLIVNARDASPNGGRITIRTRLLSTEESTNLPFPSRSGVYVELSISDEGEGMDPTTAKRIFEPYFTTKGDQGNGLGLSTVYGIVTRTGGHVHVETGLGAGTTFHLYLPLAASEPDAETHSRVIRNPAARAPLPSLDATALRTLLNGVDDAIYISTADEARFVHVNDAACRMVGYSREDLLQMGPSDLKVASLRGGDREWTDQVSLLRSTGTLGLATVHRRKDGAVLPVEIRITLQEQDGGEYVVGICRDARRPIASDEPNADRRMVTLERMAGWVAHRINDPLTSVASNLDWLGERVGMDPEIARVVEEAQRGVRQAGESIAHVARLTEAESDAGPFHESGDFVRWQPERDAGGKPREKSGDWPVTATPIDVLIIDDDKLSRMALTRLLRPHRVHVAESGAVALRMLDTIRYDLVLCDLMMPELTGMELYSLVSKRDPETARRMIFVTGGAFTEEAKRFSAEHARRCFAKPIRRGALEDILRIALGARPKAASS